VSGEMVPGPLARPVFRASPLPVGRDRVSPPHPSKALFGAPLDVRVGHDACAPASLLDLVA